MVNQAEFTQFLGVILSYLDQLFIISKIVSSVMIHFNTIKLRRVEIVTSLEHIFY